jgi:hypothetical protein
MSPPPRRGVKGAPHRKPCRDCRAPLLLVRDAEDPAHTHVLNAEPIEGGTVIVIDERAHEVPPGRGLGYTRHTCGHGVPAGGGTPDPEEVF